MLGLLASFVAGLLTLIPALGMTDTRRAITAVVVIVIAVIAQTNFAATSGLDYFHIIFAAAVYAVVSYKLLLQPLVLPGIASAINRATGSKLKVKYSNK